MDEQKLVAGFTLILEGLGVDLASPHFDGTPERAARAWYHELCRGLTGPPPKITTFPARTSEMILLRHIPIRSMCAHHLLPFSGAADIGYIPGGRHRILGLSKLSRIADYHARRPQVQEELTADIADAITALVCVGDERGTGGVGVVIRASHSCMTLRGVGHSGEMVTSAVRGVFKDDSDVRNEFLRLLEVRG